MGADVEIVLFKKKMARIKQVDLQVFIEHIFVEYPSRTFPASHSFLFVNQEFLHDWDMHRIKDGSVVTVCKTHAAVDMFRALGVNAKYVGFGNSFEMIENFPSVNKLPGCMIHIAGKSPFKGTQLLFEAWRISIDSDISHQSMLIAIAFHSDERNDSFFKYWNRLNPKPVKLPPVLLNIWPAELPLPSFEAVGSIYLCVHSVSFQVVNFLQKIAISHACPSVVEGWGHYIDEGRRAGAVVLVLDGAPMNELIDATCGVLIPAISGPPVQGIFQMYADICIY